MVFVVDFSIKENDDFRTECKEQTEKLKQTIVQTKSKDIYIFVEEFREV